MHKFFNNLIANKINAVIFAMIIILLPVLTVGCNKQSNISYKVEFTFSGYSPENDYFQKSLSQNNSKYECTVSMFDYYKCTAYVSVYQYKNDKLVTGKPVFKANITQMRVDFGVACASYNLYKENEMITEVDFCFDDFHLSKGEIGNGAFMLKKEIGIHKFKFDIPALPQYGTKEISFEIVLNVIDDTRTRYSEIYFSEGENKREPDEIINGIDFFIVNEQPTFAVNDTVSGEYLTGNGGGTMPCGGSLYASYRKLDESYNSNPIVYTIRDGLYLCNVSFLNSSEYVSNSYQCYILFKR